MEFRLMNLALEENWLALPKLPFFLFDLDKATTLEGGSLGARDFLAETFFSSYLR